MGKMSSARRALVVDDDRQIREVLCALVSGEGFDCVSAASVDEAEDALRREQFDIVLCDVKMPGRSGMELLATTTAASPDVPVVMITAADDRDLAERALEMGAAHFVIKPFTANEILIAVSNALRRSAADRRSRKRIAALHERVERRTDELNNALSRLERAGADLAGAHEDAVEGLAKVLEMRDLETRSHTERISRYASIIAERAGLPAERREVIRVGAIMHDIGKIAVPDAILRKSGALDSLEYEEVKIHAAAGKAILARWNVEPFLAAATICLTHHERWDGSGYPNGLAGEKIPVEGRIVAVADAFDAMTIDRGYAPVRTAVVAAEELTRHAGTQFDPTIVTIFLGAFDDIEAVFDDVGARRVISL